MIYLFLGLLIAYSATATTCAFVWRTEINNRKPYGRVFIRPCRERSEGEDLNHLWCYIEGDKWLRMSNRQFDEHRERAEKNIVDAPSLEP